MKNKLNGARVEYRNDTIFIALPPELWTTSGACSCGYCAGHGFWDTLAVPAKPKRGKLQRTCTVHHPELHGDVNWHRRIATAEGLKV